MRGRTSASLAMSIASRSASHTRMIGTGRIRSIGASRGAYCFFAVCILLLLPAMSAFAASHIGRGDFDFYLDSASFRGKDGKALTEVSIRIPSHGLKYKQKDGAWNSNVSLSILIRDENGKEIVRRGEKVTFTEAVEPDAQPAVTFETVIKQFYLAP